MLACLAERAVVTLCAPTACVKEAKKRALHMYVVQRDKQGIPKRMVREMLQFWRFYEGEERDTLRQARAEEKERRKREEEEREARRQKRKLNFLLTQTELYSHFVKNKIGGKASCMSLRLCTLNAVPNS